LTFSHFVMTILPPAGTGKRGRTLDALLAALQTLLLERGADAFSISDISERAGVAQGTFYNYASSIDELVEELATLLSASLAFLGRLVPSSEIDPVAAFAFKTRRTLGISVRAPDYGRLLFDSGLPVDRLLADLRRDLEADIRIGAASGVFKTANPALSASMVAGCILGAGLDLHRGKLPKSAIEAATAEMLVMLGLQRTAAQQASAIRIRFETPAPLPLQWLALVSDKGISP
jgi:AcrR family transcriptional regulator